MEIPDSLLVVHAMALEHLGMFLDPAYTFDERYQRLLAMKPQEADYERVFRGKLLDGARALYGAMWGQPPPPLRGAPDQTRLWVRVAFADDFVAWNRRGAEFPGGYRKLALDLVPGVVWVAWKFVAPGETTGLSFDGIVRLDDRFVWFPQPWRLAPIGGATPTAG